MKKVYQKEQKEEAVSEFWQLRQQLRAWIEDLGSVRPDYVVDFVGLRYEGMAEELLEVSKA